MKVIVCGAGRVGYGIAQELARERNAVTVIDTSPALIDRVTTDLDVRGVVGHGAHPDVLERAGARDAEMIIAVTFSDEVNMIACQVAHSLFDVHTKIARVRAQNYLDAAWSDLFGRTSLPIDVKISPELEVANAILRRLETPGAFDSIDFDEGRIRVLGLTLLKKSSVLSTPLSQIRELFQHLTFSVVGIRRDGDVFAASDADQLYAGNSAYVVVAPEHQERVMGLFRGEEETGRNRRVLIVGAGNIGVYVARQLERRPGLRVRLVEADKAKAERAAIALKRTVVLHGDGLDPSLLAEAGADEAEVVVSLSNDDKVNILSAALAKQAGARRAICLINQRAYKALKDALGVDVFVDPRTTTVSTILQHVRKGRITGLQYIDDGAAQIVEGEALSTSPLVGKTIGKAGLPDGVAIGAVLRGDTVIAAHPDLEVKTHDRLVLLATRDQVGEVERMFRVALEYY